MPYHVRIAENHPSEESRWTGETRPETVGILRSSYGFNLDEPELRQRFVVPWQTDARIFAGNRVLTRSEAGIWIYEAPPVNLADRRADQSITNPDPGVAAWLRGRDWQDLAWRDITRTGRDVTRQFISGRTGRWRVIATKVLAIPMLVLASLIAIVLTMVIWGSGQDTAEEPVPAIEDACWILSGADLSRALGLAEVRQQSTETAGDAVRCDYVEAVSGREIFVMQVRDTRSQEEARRRVEETAGKPVPGVGDVARYEQSAVVPSTMVFAKGWRFFRLESLRGPLPEQTMVEMASAVVRYPD